MSPADPTTSIPARDGYPLAATIVEPASHEHGRRVVVINAAMGVPARFYRRFADALAAAGMTVVLWDYRGIAASRQGSLRGFRATAEDWVFQDMAGVIDWVVREVEPQRLFLVGHSLGGQVAGLLDNADRVDGMVTLSAQSGYWRMQGGLQKYAVLLHGYVSLPWITRLCGYAPWRRLGLGQDLPRSVALRWAAWLRSPGYLFDDDTLPLERYRSFQAPVLAYSFADDDWGTARSVDALMKAYPNVERRHVAPADFGMASIGHVGFFRASGKPLWDEVIRWMSAR
jgi:predicted alpha/beta hydrolase